MRERKTNDHEILELLQEGKSQKQIAEHFNCSPVAVCKRIKRLAPPPDMPHFNQLTDKEKRFVLEKVRGKGNIHAVLQSYDVTSRESAKVMGSQLMSKPEIQMSITELMEYCGIDKPYRIRRLKQVIDSSDLNIAHKGLDMSFKLDGSYAPERHLHAVDICSLHADLAELEQQEKLLREAIGDMEQMKQIEQEEKEVNHE